MTFKANWENTATHYRLPAHLIRKMIRSAYPNQRIQAFEIMPAGCANLNIRFSLQEDAKTHILRIYLRDQNAAYRERKIAELLDRTLPVPKTGYIGEVDSYRFAVTEYIPGISLSEHLLKHKPHNRQFDIMTEAGEMLAKLREFQFSESGFFDQALNIIIPLNRKAHIHFIQECLRDKNVISQLAAPARLQIKRYFDCHATLLPDKDSQQLVHGDFDPANILVNKVNGQWKISGILDWEFAFSGSILCDVANMLRYAHQMPSDFTNAFLKGLDNGGVILPKNWQIRINMLNLLSLLDCLKRTDPCKRPNQYQDICQLIDNILSGEL